MAIKSKGKTKPKQISRGPRREAVPVPKPFAQRRWVQVTAAFIVGILAVMLFAWVRDGLHRNEAANALTTRKQAVSTWQAFLEGKLSTVGQLQGPAQPAIGQDVITAAGDLAKGKTPTQDAATLTSTGQTLGTVGTAISTYDMADAIRDHGLSEDEASSLTTAQNEIGQGLIQLKQAATLSALALSAHGAEKKQLAAAAKEAADAGAALLQDGWRLHINELLLVGLTPGGSLSPVPSGLGGGLGGGALPGGTG